MANMFQLLRSLGFNTVMLFPCVEVVPALIAAGSIKDERIQVQRSYVTALGLIGKPAAVPAIPLLKELAKFPRVKWAAEAALKNIE